MSLSFTPEAEISSPTLNLKRIRMNSNEFRNCAYVIDELLSSCDCCQFLQPVPTTATVYHAEINTAMDFLTLEYNLYNDKYNNYDRFIQDLELIWENAKAFHRSFDMIYQQAVNIQQRYKRIITFLNSGQAPYFLSIPNTNPKLVGTNTLPEENLSNRNNLSPMYREIHSRRKTNLYFVQAFSDEECKTKRVRGFSKVMPMFQKLNAAFFKYIHDSASTGDMSKLPLPRFYIAKNRTLLTEAQHDASGSFAIFFNVNITPLTSNLEKDLHKLTATVVTAKPLGEMHGFDASAINDNQKSDNGPKSWFKIQVTKVTHNVETVINSNIERHFFKKAYNTYRLSTSNSLDMSKVQNTELAKHFVMTLTQPISVTSQYSDPSKVYDSADLSQIRNERENIPISLETSATTGIKTAISSSVPSQMDLTNNNDHNNNTIHNNGMPPRLPMQDAIIVIKRRNRPTFDRRSDSPPSSSKSANSPGSGRSYSANSPEALTNYVRRGRISKPKIRIAPLDTTSNNRGSRIFTSSTPSPSDHPSMSSSSSSSSSSGEFPYHSQNFTDLPRNLIRIVPPEENNNKKATAPVSTEDEATPSLSLSRRRKPTSIRLVVNAAAHKQQGHAVITNGMSIDSGNNTNNPVISTNTLNANTNHDNHDNHVINNNQTKAFNNNSKNTIIYNSSTPNVNSNNTPTNLITTPAMEAFFENEITPPVTESDDEISTEATWANITNYAREKNVPIVNIQKYMDSTCLNPNAEGFFKHVYFVNNDSEKVIQTFKRMTISQRTTEIAGLLALKDLPHMGQITELLHENGSNEIVGLTMQRYQRTLKQHTHAHSHHRLTACQKMDLVKQMLECIITIHKIGLAHRDLSEVNFMVNDSMSRLLADGTAGAKLFLIDFGKSTFTRPTDYRTWWRRPTSSNNGGYEGEVVPSNKKELSTWCENLPWVPSKPDHGYRHYRSIQTLPRSRNDTNVLIHLVNPLAEDLYSLGCIIWKVFSETEPWFGVLDTDIKGLREKVQDDYSIERALQREVAGNLSRQMLLMFLRSSPTSRCSAQEVLDWLGSNDVEERLVKEWQVNAPVGRQKRHAKSMFGCEEEDTTGPEKPPKQRRTRKSNKNGTTTDLRVNQAESDSNSGNTGPKKRGRKRKRQRFAQK